MTLTVQVQEVGLLPIRGGLPPTRAPSTGSSASACPSTRRTLKQKIGVYQSAYAHIMGRAAYEGMGRSLADGRPPVLRHHERRAQGRLLPSAAAGRMSRRLVCLRVPNRRDDPTRPPRPDRRRSSDHCGIWQNAAATAIPSTSTPPVRPMCATDVGVSRCAQPVSRCGQSSPVLSRCWPGFDRPSAVFGGSVEPVVVLPFAVMRGLCRRVAGALSRFVLSGRAFVALVRLVALRGRFHPLSEIRRVGWVLQEVPQFGP
jgi:hypothetical protein